MTPDSERRTGRIDISDHPDGSIEFAIDVSWEHGDADSSPAWSRAMRARSATSADSRSTAPVRPGRAAESSWRDGAPRGLHRDDPSQCEAEALSGRTLASADGREAIITYDGASDCTDPPRSPWTLDGAPQPAIGIGCRAVPGAQTGAFLPLATLLALALWRARRARQTS